MGERSQFPSREGAAVLPERLGSFKRLQESIEKAQDAIGASLPAFQDAFSASSPSFLATDVPSDAIGSAKTERGSLIQGGNADANSTKPAASRLASVAVALASFAGVVVITPVLAVAGVVVGFAMGVVVTLAVMATPWVYAWRSWMWKRSASTNPSSYADLMDEPFDGSAGGMWLLAILGNVLVVLLVLIALRNILS